MIQKGSDEANLPAPVQGWSFQTIHDSNIDA